MFGIAAGFALRGYRPIVEIMFGDFVALGFEHSIANMYLLSIGWLEGARIGVGEMALNLAVEMAQLLQELPAEEA